MLYSGSTAVSLGALGPEFLYDVTSGVLQGCPLSGIFFVWAMDVFIRMMTKKVQERGLGILRICADDVGAALRSIWSLLVLVEIFAIAEAVSGLGLNLHKCVVVPTATSWSLELMHRIKTWLQVNLTYWA